MTAAYKNWSEKLNKTLVNDRLEGVQPIGLRPAGLDDTELLQAPSPPLPQSELAAVIASHRTEVKQSFQLRKELGKPAEPGAKGSVRHVSTYDDSKMAKFEADMLKRFGDKVSRENGTQHAPHRNLWLMHPCELQHPAATSQVCKCNKPRPVRFVRAGGHSEREHPGKPRARAGAGEGLGVQPCQ